MALQSLIDQTYKVWECIIINDGSEDNTEDIAKKWSEKDSRFRYVLQKNAGVSAARNLGLKMAKGVFIQFLDGDDYLERNKFELSIKEFNADSTRSLIITNFEKCDLGNKKRMPPYCELQGQQFSYESLLLDWGVSYTIPIHCGLFSSSLLADFTFDEKLKAEEDWMMWLHVFSKNPTYSFVNQNLAIYRSNPNGATGNTLQMAQHRAKAFGQVLDSIDEKYLLKFAHKINRYWASENVSTLTQLRIIINTTSYKLGNFIVKLISNPRKLIKQSK